MAKGFTVKAAVPKQKKNENTFDIAECRQLIRGKQSYSVYLVEEYPISF